MGLIKSTERQISTRCTHIRLCVCRMMEVEVGRHNVLLVRSEGIYSAIGNQCTHYGAPLSKGVLSGHRVRCPWHGACFNIQTGDLEEYPGMDCLPCHTVKVENNKVYVSDGILGLSVRVCAQVPCVYVVACVSVCDGVLSLSVSAGSASLVCAETLRQENFGGRIIMVTRDNLLPYDKTRLSKVNYPNSLSEAFSSSVLLSWQAMSLDTEKKKVTFDDGSVQSYDQLLISTGSKGLECPGKDLENVKMLETPEDARQIHVACMGCHIVIVGTSFVGMEVASYMTDKASSITVIGSSELPYQKTLGPEIGKVTMMMLAEKDVAFYMNDNVSEVRGENGKVKEVVLKSGTVIPADVLIVGIGVIPNSEFLQGTPIAMDSKSSVIVDKCMRTNVLEVFCGGDLATFPLTMAKDQRVNIGHWQMAQAHGRVAALNMLNIPTELNSVPYYWTVLLGKNIRYTGYGEGYTDIVVKGKVEEQKFLAFYIKDDEVIAAASLNYDPAVSAVAERFAAGNTITKKEAEYVATHIPLSHCKLIIIFSPGRQTDTSTHGHTL
uniref:Apoptosis inducing factor mitochondria associated 5 n=1 Tax=Oncorhynchus kisutch TaxID=8019 RepID=A0A8C7L5F2_ONCKI